ncbi:hypothetical protein [Porcipelethomonas sp.]|uniref:hypothetical protein n=1 Tax=Porcipelethomonas sp. TaxID=2981675 RepID=UPI003EF2B1F6
MPNFKYDGFIEVVIKSQKGPLSGQKNRSSGNYLFTSEAFAPCKKVKWSCPEGISFNVMKDHNAAKDETILTGVCNGSVTDLPSGEGIYIANPSGADSEFEIRVTKFE